MSTLDKIAALVQEAQTKSAKAFLFAQRVPVATTEGARVELVSGSQEAARASFEAANEALNLLQEAGVRVPAPGKPKPEPNPLAQLARVERSRPEALALLEALRAALPRAEDLDTVRGDVLAEPVNGLRGLVWGEELCQLIARLELAYHGPSERVTGGRE